MNRRSLLKLPLAVLALGIFSKSKLLEEPKAESSPIQPMPIIGYVQFPFTATSAGANTFTFNSLSNTGTFNSAYNITLKNFTTGESRTYVSDGENWHLV